MIEWGGPEMSIAEKVEWLPNYSLRPVVQASGLEAVFHDTCSPASTVSGRFTAAALTLPHVEGLEESPAGLDGFLPSYGQ